MADINFNEIFEKLSSNPQIVTKINDIAKNNDEKDISETLPKIIEAISPLVNEASNTNSNEDAQAEQLATQKKEATEDAVPTGVSLPISKLSDKISKNSKLLIALKPYLSKQRGDIIDSILKMSQIADIMKLAR